MANATNLEPEDAGFFDAGEQGCFWAIVGSVVAFLLSECPCGFPRRLAAACVSIGFVIHDIAALVMSAGSSWHIYESTAQQPETFGAIIQRHGLDRWAWTHHPGGFDSSTGRDPHSDYERALREQERDRSASR